MRLDKVLDEVLDKVLDKAPDEVLDKVLDKVRGQVTWDSPSTVPSYSLNRSRSTATPLALRSCTNFGTVPTE